MLDAVRFQLTQVGGQHLLGDAGKQSTQLAEAAVGVLVERPEDQQQALREVLTQLRVRTGHDFSNYKRPTLLRRIERRINVCELPDLPAYAALLRENPDEVHALLKDLLISVTNFFRDKEAFAALEQGRRLSGRADGERRQPAAPAMT